MRVSSIRRRIDLSCSFLPPPTDTRVGPPLISHDPPIHHPRAFHVSSTSHLSRYRACPCVQIRAITRELNMICPCQRQRKHQMRASVPPFHDMTRCAGSPNIVKRLSLRIHQFTDRQRYVIDSSTFFIRRITVLMHPCVECSVPCPRQTNVFTI